MIIAIKDIKLRHTITRIVQHESNQRINRRPDNSPRQLMIIHIDRIPAEAAGLVIVRSPGDDPVAVRGDVLFDFVEGVAEHFDDDWADAVAGLAAVEVVDF